MLKKNKIKLLILMIIFTIFLLNNTTIIAYNKLESIYKKIDIFYNNEPLKLEKINKKIALIIKKTKKEKTKNILIKLNNYINYKFKNKIYYNLKVLENTKNIVKEINKNSFTNKERLEKLEKILKNNYFPLIDKEYINYYIMYSKVSILLNHQNFLEAKKLTVKYFFNKNKYEEKKFDFLARNVEYQYFGLLTQIITLANIDKKWFVVSSRTKYFPDEKNTAYNIVRKIGYQGTNCEKLTIKNINIDLIDKKICKIINGNFNKKDVTEIEKLNNNLQNLSDKINYYYYVGNIKGYKNKMEEKREKLGKIIIEYDKNFINGYLILLNVYDYKKDCINFKKYFNLLKKNYIGDSERKSIIFGIKYQNCGK